MLVFYLVTKIASSSLARVFIPYIQNTTYDQSPFMVHSTLWSRQSSAHSLDVFMASKSHQQWHDQIDSLRFPRELMRSTSVKSSWQILSVHSHLAISTYCNVWMWSPPWSLIKISVVPNSGLGQVAWPTWGSSRTRPPLWSAGIPSPGLSPPSGTSSRQTPG